MTLRRTGDDGGSSILGYELWRNQGTGTVDFIKVSTYAGQASSHTLTVGTAPGQDSLVAGSIYFIRSRAQNAFAFSEASEAIAVGLASLPAAPASLTKVVAESTAAYITLEWAKSADTELPVLGYLLSMRDSLAGAGTFQVAYNGTDYPNVRKFTVADGAVSGREYIFKVQALNFNGPGSASAEVKYYICVSPSVLSPPILEAVTKTTMTLKWAPPATDGGCEILSYSIFMDDGAAGSFSEQDAASVNNKPTLRVF